MNINQNISMQLQSTMTQFPSSMLGTLDMQMQVNPQMLKENPFALEQMFQAVLETMKQNPQMATVLLPTGLSPNNALLKDQPEKNNIHSLQRNIQQIKTDITKSLKMSRYEKLLISDKLFLEEWKKSETAIDDIDNTTDLSLLMVCAVLGNTELGYKLLEEGAQVDLNNKAGHTALIFACILGEEEFLELLLKYKADVNVIDKNQVSALIHATLSANFEIVKILLQHKADIQSCTLGGHDALHIAAEKGLTEILDWLLVKGKADLESKDLNGFTPLMRSAFHNHSQIAQLLVDNGVDVNVANSAGNTAVHIYADNKGIDCLKIILKHGADVNYPNKSGITPLMFAALKDDTQIVEKLLKDKTLNSIDARDKLGRTALHYSASQGKHRVIARLIKAKANLNIADKKGLTPFMYACVTGNEMAISTFMKCKNYFNHEYFMALFISVINNHEQVVKTLLSQFKNDPKPLSITYEWRQLGPYIPLLHAASQVGNREIMKLLLKNGEEVNAVNALGQTALMVGVILGHQDIVQILISHTADVNISDINGDTPLIIASLNGHTEIVKFLLKAKASTHLSNAQSRTALMQAACSGKLDVIKLLNEPARNLNDMETEGWTALMLSAQLGHTQIVKYLLEKGASHTKRSRQGVTALIIAAGNGRAATVEELINHGALVDEKGFNGMTPLLISAQCGHGNVADILIKKDADVNSTCSAIAYNTPLALSVMRGDKVIVASLLEAKANTNIVNSDGFSPLHLACIGRHPDIVKMLINSGAQVDKVDKNMRTPLMYAAEKGDGESIRFLLQKGVDCNLYDSKGWNPLMLCSQHGLTACMEIFLGQTRVNIEAKETSGHTVLSICAANGLRDAICLLLSKGADPNTSNNLGFTPLMLSAINGHLEVVRTLLNNTFKKASLEMLEPAENRTALLLAAQSNRANVVKALIDAKANINSKTKANLTALHISVRLGNAEVVAELTEKKADLEIADLSGNTPLLTCAVSGTHHVMKHLLDFGADASHKNHNGETALQISIAKKCRQAVRLLLDRSNMSESEKQIFVAMARGDPVIEGMIQQFTVLSDDDDGAPRVRSAIKKTSDELPVTTLNTDPVDSSSTEVETLEERKVMNIYVNTDEKASFDFSKANIQNLVINQNSKTVVENTPKVAIGERSSTVTCHNSMKARNMAVNDSTIIDRSGDSN
ncbi:unnamed protein product [Lymnaea stagnalis]|uniref:Uncharacterized protein n=1 Tax=Lymnaea stagnalis TaxID=6523 RepID=A0AAV2IG64_LYMST